MSLIGKRIGHVLITAPIGAGGMGEVFLGFDEKLERKVAVKALKDERRLNAQSKARLLREARLLSKLDHPGLCRIYDLVEQEDTDFLILEFVEGKTLGAIFREPVTDIAALEIFAEVAQALAVAHGEGVIHRDLKPDNVMVTPEGRAKILDFGVARSVGSPFVKVVVGGDDQQPPQSRGGDAHQPGKDRTLSLEDDWERTRDTAGLTVRTREGSLVGTIAYMSPEQAAGGEITPASDLFSFGVMMQEMLTGKPAYGDAAGPDLLLRVFRAEVVTARGIADDVAALIRSLVNLDPSARPSAFETARRIRWILETPQRRRRRTARLAVVGAVATALLAAAGVAVHSRWEADRKTAMARRFAADAEDLEWRMRAEHLSPPHDLRPARAWIEARVSAIEHEITTLGRYAEGPGYFAVGRGHMALGDYRAARVSLERSWTSGFRGPEVALALGMTYGQLYAEELKALNAVSDPRVRQYELARIERDLRDPALERLAEGREAGEQVREHVEGLMALYEGRLDEAVQLADARRGASVWFYEPELAAAQAAVMQAQQLDLGEQNFVAALEKYELARNHLLLAAQAARSDLTLLTQLNWVERQASSALIQLSRLDDARARLEHLDEQLGTMRVLDPDSPQLFRDLAVRDVLLARLVHSRGDDCSELFADAVAAGDRAVELAPESPASYGVRGWVRQWQAWYFVQVGRDIRPVSEAIITDTTRFLETSDEPVKALATLAMAYYLRGLYETWYGGSPLQWVEAGIEAADRCLEVAPDLISCWEHLGSLTFLEGYYGCRHGRDGEAAFARSIEAYDRVAAASSGTSAPGTLGFAHYERAVCRMQRGADPSADLDRVLELLEPIEEAIPATLFARGLAELGLARYARAVGDDPSPHLERASAAYEEGLAVDPNNIEAYCERTEIHLEIAAAAHARGQSPEPALAAARASIEAGTARNPSFPALYVRQGEINLEQARTALGGTTIRTAEAALALARTALEHARDLHPDDAVTALRLAELCDLEGVILQSRGAAVDAAVDEGLRWAETALEINSNEARAHVVRARLETLRAHALEDGPERESALAAAQAAAQTALEHNPLLRSELAPRAIPTPSRPTARR